MLERLLERISLSDYKTNFILKGGMLVADLVRIEARSTIDMDTSMKDYPMSKSKIEEVFHYILSIELDDGVTLIVTNIQNIRAADDYDGFRVSLDAIMEKARIPIKVDITTGDKITPKEIIYSFDLLLDNRSINILAYNIESVLAEKLETIISRGSGNTRMRDFYDGYILLKMQSNQVDLDVLAEAIKETADYRGTRGTLASAEENLSEILSNDQMLAYCIMHQKQYHYASEISLTEVRESIEF